MPKKTGSKKPPAAESSEAKNKAVKEIRRDVEKILAALERVEFALLGLPLQIAQAIEGGEPDEPSPDPSPVPPPIADDPPEEPDEPEPVPEVLAPADREAINSMRQGERVQVVPRRGKWRVDYRTPGNQPVIGREFGLISAALSNARQGEGFPDLPVGDAVMDADEQQAIAVRLAALGDKGSCSVRWESNGTHADHNWKSADLSVGSNHHWEGRGLISEPVAWLEEQRREFPRR